jgi:hypothetical protein
MRAHRQPYSAGLRPGLEPERAVAGLVTAQAEGQVTVRETEREAVRETEREAVREMAKARVDGKATDQGPPVATSTLAQSAVGRTPRQEFAERVRREPAPGPWRSKPG